MLIIFLYFVLAQALLALIISIGWGLMFAYGEYYDDLIQITTDIRKDFIRSFRHTSFIFVKTIRYLRGRHESLARHSLGHFYGFLYSSVRYRDFPLLDISRRICARLT